MIEESIVELDILDEECKWLACEEPCRDIAVLLEELQIVRGSAFVNQLKLITAHRAFYPVNGETDIYSTGGERGEDYVRSIRGVDIYGKEGNFDKAKYCSQ